MPSIADIGNSELQESSFLLAIWNELFDPFTPDSFQPRIHNTPSLIEELNQIILHSDKNPLWNKHINKIQQELEFTSGKEQDLLESIPEYTWQLANIIKANVSPKEIQIGCCLLMQRREEYERILFNSIRDTPAKLRDNKKKHGYTALHRLGTLAIQSSKEDDDVLTNLPQPNESSENIIKTLISSTAEGCQKYDCVFAVIGEQSHIQRIASKIGFSFIRSVILPTDYVKPLRNSHREVHFIKITNEGYSIRDAVIKAKKMLNKGVDVINLYSNSAVLEVATQVLVKREAAEEYTQMDQLGQAFRKLYPRSRTIEDSLETLELVDRNRLEDRALSALELHSFAISSSDPRVKIINLWSALECLAGCVEGDSILKRVLNLIKPLLVWRRVDKVVRYTAIATCEFQKVNNIKLDANTFSRSDENFVHPWDMLLVLCRPKNHTDITKLLNFASNHPLLLFRIYSLWNEFKNPKTLRNKLLRSENNIDWQLTRIYRARNLLVHHGVEVSNIGSLLDNLQYYSSIVIQRIIHGMKVNKNWGVRESSKYWNWKTQYILDSLQNNPKSLLVSDFFPRESQHNAPRLWP
ncbi:MAG: hypothetical protein NXI29_23115 [bacterium]|nr:hypothetical protein [bacterium]